LKGGPGGVKNRKKSHRKSKTPSINKARRSVPMGEGKIKMSKKKQMGKQQFR